MKLLQLYQAVFCEPSLITAAAHASIRSLLEARMDDVVHFNADIAKREGTYCGEKVELESMQIIDGIAEIPIGGAIGYKLSGVAKYAGAVDTQDLQREISEAMSNDEVKAAFFDFDSPGGMVTSTPETGEMIAQLSAKKPTVAFTSGMMASAAYWLGSSAGAVYATRSADVGSIGVYLPVFDYTGAYEQAGVKVELIKAGKLKGIGFPGTPLTESQRDHLKSRVMQIYDDFKAHVQAHRGGTIADDTMQGQTFHAGEAAARGLVDLVVPNRATALELLRLQAGL